MNLGSYLFWPNPPVPHYSDSKVIFLLLLCGAMTAGSFVFSQWRKRQKNPMTKKLTRSYGHALFWFGVIGLFLTVCRVEGISYLSMRFLWFLWGAAIAFFIGFQYKMFRVRHYEILPRNDVNHDPRMKYLPGEKR